uniref:Uncharacterized protein n=1 Tax=Falco tinnunculus TaxID=100819 RepID=A0A8C4UNB8_FALTI
MTSSIKESGVCSPDSTVSSLLTNYSTDSNTPYSNTLIHYKGKLYSSASEALEAYIEDFDLSLTSSETSTGKICICQNTPKQVKFSNHVKYLCFSELDDFNQHVGLGFLASPSRRQSECDPDSISLATDDLLAFPADGSLPFVQHNPLKSEHQSSEWNRWSLKTSFCPCQTSLLDTASGFSLQENEKAVDQLELLTLKVNRSLESSTEDLSNNLKNDGSPTTDILGAEMTWEKCSRCFVEINTQKSVFKIASGKLQKLFILCENTFSGGHHHRPLEALKLMLFKLQQKEEFEKVVSFLMSYLVTMVVYISGKNC